MVKFQNSASPNGNLIKHERLKYEGKKKESKGGNRIMTKLIIRTIWLDLKQTLQSLVIHSFNYTYSKAERQEV